MNKISPDSVKEQEVQRFLREQAELQEQARRRRKADSDRIVEALLSNTPVIYKKYL